MDPKGGSVEEGGRVVKFSEPEMWVGKNRILKLSSTFSKLSDDILNCITIHQDNFMCTTLTNPNNGCKKITVNGGYGGVVVYAMRRLLHLLRGPPSLSPSVIARNVLTNVFTAERG